MNIFKKITRTVSVCMILVVGCLGFVGCGIGGTYSLTSIEMTTSLIGLGETTTEISLTDAGIDVGTFDVQLTGLESATIVYSDTSGTTNIAADVTIDGDDITIQLESGQEISGFGDNLVGSLIGDTLKITVTANDLIEAIYGSSITFGIDITMSYVFTK